MNDIIFINDSDKSHFQEKVKEGELATFPTTSEYKEPVANNPNIVFLGWDYDWENDPINSNTDINPQWGEKNFIKEIHAKVDKSEVMYTGGRVTCTVWGEYKNGDRFIKGIQIVEEGSGTIQWENYEPPHESRGIIPVGKIETDYIARANQNTGQNNLSYSFYARYEVDETTYTNYENNDRKEVDIDNNKYYLKSDVVTISQLYNNVNDTVLNEQFDFLTIDFSSDYDDLDICVAVRDTDIMINDNIQHTNKPLDYYPIGNGCRGSVCDPDYGGTNVQLYNDISYYIKGGGRTTNQSQGNETVLIKFGNIINNLPNQNVDSIKVDIYANWYGKPPVSNNRKCDIDLSLYRKNSDNGDIELKRDEHGKSKFEWETIGDVERVHGETIQNVNVFSYGSINYGKYQEEKFYTHLGTLVYFTNSREAIFKNANITQLGEGYGRTIDCTANIKINDTNTIPISANGYSIAEHSKMIDYRRNTLEIQVNNLNISLNNRVYFNNIMGDFWTKVKNKYGENALEKYLKANYPSLPEWITLGEISENTNLFTLYIENRDATNPEIDPEPFKERKYDFTLTTSETYEDNLNIGLYGDTLYSCGIIIHITQDGIPTGGN